MVGANHGGGYHYSLCPADTPLTEDCFNKLPLSYVGSNHTIRYLDGRAGLCVCTCPFSLPLCLCGGCVGGRGDVCGRGDGGGGGGSGMGMGEFAEGVPLCFKL